MNKKSLIRNLILVLAILIIVVIVVCSIGDIKEIYRVLTTQCNYLYILICLGLLVGYCLCFQLSLTILMKRKMKSLNIVDSMLISGSEFFFNGITPFNSGGQPFQIYLLNKEKIKVSDSLNALIQNFITYQFGLIFTSTIAIIVNAIFKILPDSLLLQKIVLIGYFVNIIVMGVIIFISRAKKVNTKIFSKIFKFIFHFKFIKNKEEKEEKFLKYLDDFYNSTAMMKNNKKNTILSFIFNLISLCFLYLIPVFVFYSFGHFKLDFIESFISSSFTFLIGSFVPIPGATGGLEYGFIDFFKVFISNSAMLSAGMLLWRLITYYFSMVLGGIILMTYRRKDK